MFLPATHKKGRTFRMKEDKTAPLHVATNVVFIRSNPETKLNKPKKLVK